MKILISGKNIEVGESLTNHIEARLGDILNKYLARVVAINVVLTKEAHSFRADINGNTGTSSGVIIKSSASAGDVYACFDNAAEKIETQLRRYKRRLTNHHKKYAQPEASISLADIIATKYVIKDHHDEESHDDNPVVIAEKATSVETLTVSEAVMKMGLADLPALLFFNSATGKINVVYKRADGNISWVSPEEKAA
ncbi:MAG: ribosome-associated translation inhibitor RaiA [Pseudomonadota bacterium]